MKNAVNNNFITQETIFDTSSGYTYPLDDTDWLVLQAWQSIVPSTVWMNENCREWPRDKLDDLHQRLQTLVAQVLPDNWLHDYSTPASQACYLRCYVDDPLKFEPFTLFNPHDTKPPLCFIHPAMFSAFTYYGLAQFIKQDRPLLAIHSCQPLEKNPAKINGLDRLRSVAAHYTDLLLAVQPQGAYHLGGWSLGGLLSLEMAKCLQKKGKRVASLSLIDPFFSVHSKPGIIQRYLNKFLENNQTHQATQYFSSLTQGQLLMVIKKWIRIERTMLVAFDFSLCDVPTLIIRGKDNPIDHQQNIEKFFSNHQLIHSDFNHFAMMDNECTHMMAQFINDHIKANL